MKKKILEYNYAWTAKKIFFDLFELNIEISSLAEVFLCN